MYDSRISSSPASEYTSKVIVNLECSKTGCATLRCTFMATSSELVVYRVFRSGIVCTAKARVRF
ncbi:hypothetical protein [Streptomyces xiaopingdaonensis]|uniref:hypothetical protein n=1 Tax=Streptomyces xiaopingdaonensis TaxID=1565415 RepID=UPI000360A94A|nr:hypothetical protein [Streptomyces xiaopingdaonensis]